MTRPRKPKPRTMWLVTHDWLDFRGYLYSTKGSAQRGVPDPSRVRRVLVVDAPKGKK